MSHPDDALLFDYALGAGSGVVEEHLFSCDACGARVDRFAALGDGIRKLVARGAFHFSATEALVKELSQRGVRLREYALEPGGDVACTVTAGDDFVLVRYAADVGGAKQVDLERMGRRFVDVLVDRPRQQVVMALAGEELRKLPDVKIRVRLIAVEAGSERVLGEYQLDHTAFER